MEGNEPTCDECGKASVLIVYGTFNGVRLEGTGRRYCAEHSVLAVELLAAVAAEDNPATVVEKT